MRTRKKKELLYFDNNVIRKLTQSSLSSSCWQNYLKLYENEFKRRKIDLYFITTPLSFLENIGFSLQAIEWPMLNTQEYSSKDSFRKYLVIRDHALEFFQKSPQLEMSKLQSLAENQLLYCARHEPARKLVIDVLQRPLADTTLHQAICFSLAERFALQKELYTAEEYKAMAADILLNTITRNSEWNQGSVYPLLQNTFYLSKSDILKNSNLSEEEREVFLRYKLPKFKQLSGDGVDAELIDLALIGHKQEKLDRVNIVTSDDSNVIKDRLEWAKGWLYYSLRWLHHLNPTNSVKFLPGKVFCVDENCLLKTPIINPKNLVTWSKSISVP